MPFLEMLWMFIMCKTAEKLSVASAEELNEAFRRQHLLIPTACFKAFHGVSMRVTGDLLVGTYQNLSFQKL